tara:strand:- start:118 stop:666 length:549 start_codon:yes stop_codon:yes gene_type:complete
MPYQVINNFLNDREVEDLSTFLDESKFWKSFSDNKKTDREAFNFTLKQDELPDFLAEFKSSKHNLYHFVAIRTHKSGSIDEHVDFALGEVLIHKQPGMFISNPETIVYYETIDPDMKGGELIVEHNSFKPTENTAVILAPGTPHAVSAIEETVKPRVVLVCERYRILSRYLKDIKTPEYKKG